MPLPTTSEGINAKKNCDFIVHKIMDVYVELGNVQDPTDAVARMMRYSLDLKNTLAAWPEGVSEYAGVQEYTRRAQAKLDEFLRKRSIQAREGTTSKQYTFDNARPTGMNIRPYQALEDNQLSQPRAETEDDTSSQDQPANSKRQKLTHEFQDEDKCTRCQRMNVPCVRKGKGRTCKLCAEAHTPCERLNVAAIASMREDLIEMHKKYEDAMAALNKVNQYSMFLSSHSLKAVASCSALKTRIDEFVPRSVQNHLQLESRVSMIETYIKTRSREPYDPSSAGYSTYQSDATNTVMSRASKDIA